MQGLSRREANGLAIGLGATAILLLFVALRRKPVSVDFSVFDSPDLTGSGTCMDRDLVRVLQALQRSTGYPVLAHITSAARSPAHNRRVGGVANSSHLIPICRAVDIHVPDRATQERLAYAAKALGIRRMGIGRTFLHLDNDPTKRQQVAWGYPSGSPPPFDPFG